MITRPIDANSIRNDKKYHPEINGLRGIAITSVIFFHMGLSLFKGGFVGVDIFFVISGYLITNIIANEIKFSEFSFVNFLVRRARRILPALICVVFFCLIMGWFLFLPDDYKSLGRSAFSLAIFCSNIYFWLKSGYFTAPAETKPLLHTWTLALEEQFYIIFPILFYFISRHALAWRNSIIVLLMLGSFLITLVIIKEHQIASFFLLPMRAWELLTGSVLALYVLQSKNSFPKFYNELISIFGFIAIGYSIIFFNQNMLYPGASALFPCLGTAAIIVSNRTQLTAIGHFLSLKPLVLIGLISYSLYLWHWALWVFARYISGTTFNFSQIIGVLTLSLVFACASYIWIETPVRKKQIFISSKAITFGSTGCLILVAILGRIIDIHNGVPNRLNANILTVYQESFPKSISYCDDSKISKHLTVCTNNKKEKPNLILWGDSHANALLPIIKKLADQYHVTFWFYSCIPVLDVYKVDEHNSLINSKCYASNKELLKVIKDKQIKNILLASFWTQFTEGREIPLEGAGQRDPFYADSLIKSHTVKQAHHVFEKHFIQTIGQLQSIGAKVWILRQVPTHLYWIANQLAKTLKYGGDTSKIGRPLVEYTRRQKFIDYVFKNIQSKNVEILDPTLILCDTTFCYATKNGHALYFDFNHLSNYGALHLEPLFIYMFSSISKTNVNDMYFKSI